MRITKEIVNDLENQLALMEKQIDSLKDNGQMDGAIQMEIALHCIAALKDKYELREQRSAKTQENRKVRETDGRH